ncbi:unnamed protein product [Penicillium camemberti]|uniref:Str. FM013 n=1 Tax=Penicillium camemberti (strain FM 013) TaxID=1429867 RepID=A0A0G4PP00_PENC3|nr:unnamed protein product [Penicillium camemberti]
MNEHSTSLNTIRCIFVLVIPKKQWPRCPFRCLPPGALSAWYDPHVHASDLKRKGLEPFLGSKWVQIKFYLMPGHRTVRSRIPCHLGGHLGGYFGGHLGGGGTPFS